MFQIEIGKTEVLVISLKWSAVELIGGGAGAHAVYVLFFYLKYFCIFFFLCVCVFLWLRLKRIDRF